MINTTTSISKSDSAIKSDVTDVASNACYSNWYPTNTTQTVVGTFGWNNCDKCICYKKDQFGKFKLPGNFVYMTEDKELKEVYIKEIMYNNPATIVFWSDGSKTVSKCHAGDPYSPEAGLTMCILKKIQEKSLINLFEAWLPKELYEPGPVRPVTINVKQVRKQFKKK
jgi:hypothetical protein